MHTVNATETVNRAIDFFPPYQQQQIRLTLAGSLRGIICQRLVRAVGGGRAPSLEVLVNTGRVSERIADSMRTHELHEVLKEGTYYGMRTFDQSLLELVAAAASRSRTRWRPPRSPTTSSWRSSRHSCCRPRSSPRGVRPGSAVMRQ